MVSNEEARKIELDNKQWSTSSQNKDIADLDIPLELHLTTSELWFGQEQEGILP